MPKSLEAAARAGETKPLLYDAGGRVVDFKKHAEELPKKPLTPEEKGRDPKFQLHDLRATLDQLDEKMSRLSGVREQYAETLDAEPTNAHARKDFMNTMQEEEDVYDLEIRTVDEMDRLHASLGDGPAHAARKELAVRMEGLTHGRDALREEIDAARHDEIAMALKTPTMPSFSAVEQSSTTPAARATDRRARSKMEAIQITRPEETHLKELNAEIAARDARFQPLLDNGTLTRNDRTNALAFRFGKGWFNSALKKEIAAYNSLLVEERNAADVVVKTGGMNRDTAVGSGATDKAATQEMSPVQTEMRERSTAAHELFLAYQTIANKINQNEIPSFGALESALKTAGLMNVRGESIEMNEKQNTPLTMTDLKKAVRGFLSGTMNTNKARAYFENIARGYEDLGRSLAQESQMGALPKTHTTKYDRLMISMKKWDRGFTRTNWIQSPPSF